MNWLNYRHLYYFWCVAREGTIARAGQQLHLTQPTISGQIHSFEKAIGVKLFARLGRNLVLTENGRNVFQYADEIFTLGRELQSTLTDRPAGRWPRLLVGVADILPKQIAYRLLEPVLRLQESVQIVCEQGSFESLLGRLAVNALDVILADAPIHPTTKIRAFSHLLGECDVSIWGSAKLASLYRRGFPQSLNGAPILLPAPNTALRRSLEQWFDAEGIRPFVRGEFADPGLLKEFGRTGMGVFAVRAAVERETQRQYGVQLLGRVGSIRERFYVISVERRLKHPAIVALTASARKKLFA
jgi:LysR family transcriptional activator of nhaA